MRRDCTGGPVYVDTPAMLRPGHVIWLCALALLTIGVLMVNSAGMSVNSTSSVTFTSIVLSKSTVYMVLALMAMTAASLLPISAWLNRLQTTSGPGFGTSSGGWSARPLWFGALALLGILALVYVPGLGKSVNGSHRWLSLPIPGMDQRMQPSEIAKWGLVLLIAWYAAVMGPRLASFKHGLLPALVAIGLVAGVIIKEDLGTGALVLLVATLLLMLAGARLWHFAMFVPIPVAGLALAVLTSEYRMKRIQTFLDPYLDPQGSGYHMIQSMTAIANGEVFGRGLGHGLQKFGYLPEDQTDFIFAIICEELGLLGAGVVICLYIFMLWAGYQVLRRQQTLILKLVAFGVIATVGFQAIVNIAVVTAMGPTKGIALPLLSSGGTGWILTAACLGLIISMDRVTADEAEPVPMGDLVRG